MAVYGKMTDPQADFEAAYAIYDRLRYSDPSTVMDVAKKTFLEPHLRDYQIAERLQAISDILSTADSLKRVERRIPLPGGGVQKPSLRARVFPEPTHFAETGSEGNRRLARILNSLSESTTPRDALVREDNVLRLPADDSAVRRDAFKAEQREALEKIKAELLVSGHFMFADMLFHEKSQGMDNRVDHGLYILERDVEDGAQFVRAFRDVINQVGDLGSLIREGYGVEQALHIFKRAHPLPDVHNGRPDSEPVRHDL